MVDGSQAPQQKRVLLLMMPFAIPYFPGLPVALIRSILMRDGIPCDIVYGNLLFSKIIDGNSFYEEDLTNAPSAELAFIPHYFDICSKEQAAQQLQAYFGPLIGSKADLSIYTTLIEHAGTLLDTMMRTIAWEQYDIVGFSAMFQQTVSSLALAKRIKQRYPHIKIIFGGPSCAAPMGQEMLRAFPEIDYVALGEVDATISHMVREIRSHPEGPFEAPGLVYRDSGGQVQETMPPGSFYDLDSVPIPDYTPYFEQLNRLGLNHFRPYLYIETSRGCWWGEKHHCTFCSIEDTVMKYRSKSEERVLQEIVEMTRRHRMTNFMVSDNILNHRFYKTLLPRLKQLREVEGYDLSFFFELKSNVRREEVQALRDAGVHYVQPGLESLSDHVLHLMNKGSTGIRQLQALKYFAEFEITPVWNIIYQNPGETPEDYDVQCDMLPFVHHLPPLNEQSLFKMMIQRYNLYFLNPAEYGITKILVPELYKAIFPDPKINLWDLAYWFEYSHPDHENPALLAAYERLKQAIQNWRRCYVKDSLTQVRGVDFIRIYDKRKDPVTGLAPTRVQVTTLTGWQAEVFAYCDPFRNESDILRQFGEAVPEQEILAFLDQSVQARLIYRSPSRQYLTLPLLKGSSPTMVMSWMTKEAGD